MKKKKTRRNPALTIVRHFYPKVESVVDGDEDILIEVTPKDSENSKVRKHAECALAVACKRELKADGVIISCATAYVIKNKVATRFKLPGSVSREVVSFDRHAGFDEGTYELKHPVGQARLGAYRTPKEDKGSHGRESGALVKRFSHITRKVRTSLKRLEEA